MAESASQPPHTQLNIRVSRMLADELKKAAAAESNSASSLVRRFITRGLREQRATEHEATKGK